jgi:hypothetical protein
MVFEDGFDAAWSQAEGQGMEISDVCDQHPFPAADQWIEVAPSTAAGAVSITIKGMSIHSQLHHRLRASRNRQDFLSPVCQRAQPVLSPDALVEVVERNCRSE